MSKEKRDLLIVFQAFWEFFLWYHYQSSKQNFFIHIIHVCIPQIFNYSTIFLYNFVSFYNIIITIDRVNYFSTSKFKKKHEGLREKVKKIDVERKKLPWNFQVRELKSLSTHSYVRCWKNQHKYQSYKMRTTTTKTNE